MTWLIKRVAKIYENKMITIYLFIKLYLALHKRSSVSARDLQRSLYSLSQKRRTFLRFFNLACKRSLLSSLFSYSKLSLQMIGQDEKSGRGSSSTSRTSRPDSWCTESSESELYTDSGVKSIMTFANLWLKPMIFYATPNTIL